MSDLPFTVEWLEGHRVDLAHLERTAIVGIGHVRAALNSVAAQLRDPERAARFGLQPPRGLLLYGVPGVGKSLSARLLALELGAQTPFYEISSDELSPDRMRGAVRYLATAHPRSVLYLDEIDSWGVHRDNESHSPETRLLLTSALAALDGLLASRGPVIVAASNRGPGQLDPALVRAGRLGYRIAFDTPDEPERLELFRVLSSAMPCATDVDWEHAARLTRGHTPADIRQITEDAAGIALAANHDRVEASDLLAAVRRGGSIDPEPAVAAAVARRRIAVHEAAHLCASIVLRGEAWAYAVRIGTFEGSTQLGSEAIPVSLRPDDENRDELVVLAAGRAGERALLLEPSTGAANDVARMTRLAMQRIAAGIAGSSTAIDLDQLDANVAEASKERLADDIQAQLDPAVDLAERIVAANIAAIEFCATQLELAGELTGPALLEVIRAAKFRDPRVVS